MTSYTVTLNHQRVNSWLSYIPKQQQIMWVISLILHFRKKPFPAFTFLTYILKSSDPVVLPSVSTFTKRISGKMTCHNNIPGTVLSDFSAASVFESGFFSLDRCTVMNLQNLSSNSHRKGIEMMRNHKIQIYTPA